MDICWLISPNVELQLGLEKDHPHWEDLIRPLMEHGREKALEHIQGLSGQVGVGDVSGLARTLSKRPNHLFINLQVQQHEKRRKVDFKAHVDEADRATVLVCLSQHPKDNPSLQIVKGSNPQARTRARGEPVPKFVDVPYAVGDTVVLNPQVLHRVKAPTHGDRLVLAIFL